MARDGENPRQDLLAGICLHHMRGIDSKIREEHLKQAFWSVAENSPIKAVGIAWVAAVEV